MNNPILQKSPQWRWNDANRHKLKAHGAVKVALRNGILKRGKCEVCGSLRVDAHHDDYTMPLIVRWLCRKHHRALHAAERREMAQ